MISGEDEPTILNALDRILADPRLRVPIEQYGVRPEFIREQVLRRTKQIGTAAQPEYLRFQKQSELRLAAQLRKLRRSASTTGRVMGTISLASFAGMVVLFILVSFGSWSLYQSGSTTMLGLIYLALFVIFSVSLGTYAISRIIRLNRSRILKRDHGADAAVRAPEEYQLWQTAIQTKGVQPIVLEVINQNASSYERAYTFQGARGLA